MYTIILSDNTEITELERNEDMFISAEPLTAETFEGKLSTVTIVDGNGNEKTLEDCVLYTVYDEDDKTWFAIGEKSEDVKLREKIAELEAVNTDLELALTELYEEVIGNG